MHFIIYIKGTFLNISLTGEQLEMGLDINIFLILIEIDFQNVNFNISLFSTFLNLLSFFIDFKYIYIIKLVMKYQNIKIVSLHHKILLFHENVVNLKENLKFNTSNISLFFFFKISILYHYQSQPYERHKK